MGRLWLCWAEGVLEQTSHLASALETSMIRNLIVHCYPRKSGMWRRTVAHLMAGMRWEQFSGRKIVSICADECTDDPWEVVQAFGHDANMEIEFVERENNSLQEVNSFLPMLEMVHSTDPEEWTTYIHCKGCTQPEGHASHRWLDYMASANFDYPELVECFAQQGKNIIGAFRSHGLWAFPHYHNWHYAGTFFTFRHSRIFGELPWSNVHQDFMGVEAWPGIVPVAESACLFFDHANTAHLYNGDFQNTVIDPAMERWHVNIQKCGLVPASMRKKEMVTA